MNTVENTKAALTAADTLTHQGAVRHLIVGLLGYAHAHKSRYESAIGDDYILGPCWLKIADGLLGLLNGETGNLDCGTMDAAIRNAAITAVFKDHDLISAGIK